MKLPTNEEIDQAYDDWSRDGLQPMAGCIDRHEGLAFFLTHAVKNHSKGEVGTDTAIKTALVTGLHIGIRIGENRGKKAN